MTKLHNFADCFMFFTWGWVWCSKLLLIFAGSNNLLSSQALGGSMMPPMDMDNADEDLPPGYMAATGMPYTT